MFSKMQNYNSESSSMDDRTFANDDDLDNWDEELISAIGQRVGKSEKDPEGVRLCRIKLCLMEGARINAQDRNGDTALHIAVKRNYQRIVEFLRQSEARADIPNHEGFTAITLAETLRKEDIAIILKNPVASDFFPVADNQQPSTSRDSDIVVQQKPTTFEDEGRGEKFFGLKEANTYPAAATLTRSWPGIVYQLKHLEFTLHCALQKDSVFFLATEMIAAGKLDDVVLQYTNDEGMQVGRFVQIKHRNNESDKISANHLLQDDGDFSVSNYFISWRKVKENKLFSEIQVRNMILCTNMNLDLDDLTEKKIHWETAAEPDKSFEMKSNVKETAWYKVSVDKKLNEMLYNELKTCVVRRLAKMLAECIYNGKPIRLEMDCFQDYHLALVKHIFDAKTREFYQKFTNNEKLSPRVEKFRQIFISEYQRIAKISKTHTSEQLVWNDIEKRFRKVEIRKNFGKAPKLVPNPLLTNLNDFTRRFVELLNNAANDCLVEIVTKNSKMDGAKEPIKVIVDNINKLAGHVLVRVGNKIKFSSQFLNDDEQLPSNIDEFRNLLMNQVRSKYELERFEFVIKNYETWSEYELLAVDELPDDIDDEEISNFLKEFTLAVNQPSLREIGEIISGKIIDNSLFNRLRADQIGSTFLSKILEWFSDKGKKGNDVEYLSYEVCKKFFDDMKRNISSCVTSGITTLYCEKIKAYDICFKSDIEEVKNLLAVDRSDSPSHRIMQLVASSDETFLYALKVYNTLRRIPKYTKENSFIFIRFEDLILPEVMDQVKLAFESPDRPDLLLIDFGSYGGVQDHRLWDSLLNIIEKNTNKKMIIITRKCYNLAIPFAIDPELRREGNGEINYANLTGGSQKKLLERRVTEFQGQEIGMSLGKLLGLCDSESLGADELKDLAEIIDSDMLVELIRSDELKLGEVMEGLGETQDHYITRTFCQRVVIKDDILQDSKIPDLLVISGVGRELPDTLERVGDTSSVEQNSSHFTVPESIKAEEQFKALCTKNVDRNIHWINKESGGYIWKQSHGDITYLLQHRYAGDHESDNSNDEVGATYLSESELAAHSKPVIISDTAGMGKSTVLIYLAQKIKETEPGMLVLKINLNHHATTFADVRKNSSHYSSIVRQPIEFLVQELLSYESISARKVFQRIMKNQLKVTLLFDGFDEISPTYENTVIDFVQALVSYGLKKLVITTRPHTRETLERKLNVFSYEMQPLSADSQEYFLTKFWTARLGSRHDCAQKTEGRIKKYSRAVMNTLAMSTDDSETKLTGNLLQARLVAEIFESHSEVNRGNFDSCEEFINSEADQPNMPEKVDLLYLYQQFVEMKFNIFFMKRGGNLADVAVQEDRSLRYQTFIKTHEKLALYALFDADTAKKLLPSLENKQDITQERTGIITQFIDGQPHFGHRTYAEYFAATFFSNMLRKGEPTQLVQEILVANILLMKEFKNMRAFMNSLVSSEHYNAFEGESWNYYLSQHRNTSNETIFHVAASEGNGHLLKLLLNRNQEALICEENHDGMTAVNIVIDNRHWDEVKLLLEHKIFDINSRNVKGETLLHYASVHGELDVVKYLVEKEANVNAEANDGYTPLLQAITTCNLDVALNKCLGNKNRNPRLNEISSIMMRKSRMYCSKLDVVEYLLDNGANVNCQEGRIGISPLLLAVLQKQLDVTKCLVKRGANVNIKAGNGITPLHMAAGTAGSLDILKYLVDEGADIDFKAQNIVTPLLVAVVNGHLDIVKCLVDKGANISFLYNGRTLMAIAAANGQLDIAKYLEEKRANVNSESDKG